MLSEGQYFYVLDLTRADIVVAKAVNPEEMVIDCCFLPQTSIGETEADVDQECSCCVPSRHTSRYIHQSLVCSSPEEGKENLNPTIGVSKISFLHP